MTGFEESYPGTMPKYFRTGTSALRQSCYCSCFDKLPENFCTFNVSVDVCLKQNSISYQYWAPCSSDCGVLTLQLHNQSVTTSLWGLIPLQSPLSTAHTSSATSISREYYFLAMSCTTGNRQLVHWKHRVSFLARPYFIYSNIRGCWSRMSYVLSRCLTIWIREINEIWKETYQRIQKKY